MWFTRISIGNPVLATMMMVAFVVLGLFSYQRLRVDQFPDVTFPVVVVQTLLWELRTSVYMMASAAAWPLFLTNTSCR